MSKWLSLIHNYYTSFTSSPPQASNTHPNAVAIVARPRIDHLSKLPEALKRAAFQRLSIPIRVFLCFYKIPSQAHQCNR